MTDAEQLVQSARAPQQLHLPPAPPPAAASVGGGSKRSGRKLRELRGALERERELFEEVQRQVGELEVRRRRLETRMQASAPQPPPLQPRVVMESVPLQFFRPRPAQPYRADPGRSSRRTAFSTDHLGGLVIGCERSCEATRRRALRDSAMETLSRGRTLRAAPPASPPDLAATLAAASRRGGTAPPNHRLPPAGRPSVTPVGAFSAQSCRRQRFYGDYYGRRILVDLRDPPRVSAVA
eukprot:TRINITY_DN2773_c0_g2_i6.p1 TRINITY_DN2773_c0_g2~~TRINITY_DN2773_c0_g2_i6.p1  ORF type:complete len:255 (+),score=103.51 TRINITY_DN2773_c0_g2_i6:52-765(+)